MTLETHYPRSHPAPLETCGILADVNSVTGQATIYMTSQAPHAHRTVFAMVAGLPEQNIRIISPDLGGGFGNKVPIYPGYVVATAASLVIGKPVKWVESRSENLISTGFARDYHMKGELAVTNDGRILGLRVEMLSDQGAFYADAQPTKFKAGLFHVVTGSYDYPAAHVTRAARTRTRRPAASRTAARSASPRRRSSSSGSCRTAAYELGIDPADMRFKNFIQPEQFPYTTPTGFVYDSGDYPTALRKALDEVGYEALREEQRQARADGRLIGIGIAHFTEAVGAGPSKTYDIVGLKMIDSAELRVHPTGKAILKLGVKTQGQGHETTFAQIVAEELGIPSPTSRWWRATPTTRRTASAPTRRARRRSAVRRPRWCRASSPTRRRRSPRTCSRRPTPTSSSRTASSPWRARPTARSRSRTSRSRRTPTCPTAWSTGSRACTTTTRRTSPTRTAATSWWSRSTPRPACGRCSAWSRSTTAACGSTR